MKIRIDNRSKNSISFFNEDGFKLKVCKHKDITGWSWHYPSYSNLPYCEEQDYVSGEGAYKKEFLSLLCKYIPKYPKALFPLIKELNALFKIEQYYKVKK